MEFISCLCLYRLEAYDRNFNFGATTESKEEFTMTLPDEKLYYDLNSDRDFPCVKSENVGCFLEQYDKHVEKVSKEMYKEKFLVYIRSAKDNNIFYLRSACRAEMSKSVTYKIDISFDCDGHIYQSQCECAAGMGPSAHCKHVCTVLHAATVFGRSRNVIVEQTCTEKLQTFHHVKKYKGSPLKSQQLDIDGANIICETNFDPRPQEMRNAPGYTDYFRNLCLSSPGISKLPIFQTFLPGNAIAVAHDHDYFVYTPEQMFLSDIGLNNIDKAYISKIEKNTQEQSNCALWRKERSKRLCSSSFGRICKATDRTDKSNLAKSFLKPSQKLRTPSILHGKKYESVAIKEYESSIHTEVSKCGLCVSEAHPFLAASPDGVVKQNDPYLIEVKCPYSSKYKEINEKTVPYLKVENGHLTLKENHDYYYQIQGQLYCTELSRCDFVVYTLSDMQKIQINRNDAFIDDMKDKLINFYDEYFCPALLNKYYYKTFEG